MSRSIINFYQKNLHYLEKQKIISEFSRPAYYKTIYFENDKPKTRNTSLKFAISWLVSVRNKLVHDADYVPFYKINQPYTATIKIEEKNEVIEIHHKLTFAVFFELTRKAMARYWLKEYQNYLKTGEKLS